MTIERTGMSRRRLLTTAAVGVPAMGVLGAVNLLGAPAAKASTLTVDGVWGESTSAGLKTFLTRRWGIGIFGGGLKTSKIDSQPESWAAANPGLGSGWEWVPDDLARGSMTIQLLQTWLKISSDGLIGPATIRALQAHYGKVTDGVLDYGSPTIAALQEEINRHI